MLPAAKGIFTGDLATLDADQRAVGSAPIAAYVLLGLVLVIIAVGSVMVFTRTNRQFNLGLVVAAVATVLVGGWLLVATTLEPAPSTRAAVRRPPSDSWQTHASSPSRPGPTRPRADHSR